MRTQLTSLSMLLISLSVGKLTLAANGQGIPQMFFDADESHFDKAGSTQRFDGNIVAIAAKILISADQLSVDKGNNRIFGQGHVILVSSNQIVTGETFTYDTDSGEFNIKEAMILVNDPDAAKTIVDKIMGFSKQELDFEIAQSKQLAHIEHSKAALRSEFRKIVDLNAAKSKDAIEQYVLLLEKQKLITEQKNISLAKISPNRREALERRRNFWKSSRSIALAQPSLMNRVGYFAVEGDEIRKLDEERFFASRAFITPCFCQKGETPAWGFRAENIDAQGGAYAELHHPVLEIGGIPILYLPFATIPLKSERQSGFLLPSLSHSNTNGSMYSQPIFLALAENADATLTSDLFERRGLRLGVEYRLQAKRYSGWEVQLEGIRDQIWLSQQEKRRNIAKRYLLGADTAKTAHEEALAEDSIATNSDFNKEDSRYDSISDPGWWKRRGLEHCLTNPGSILCRQNEIENHLLLPENTWRGQIKWRGQSIIAPRLSLMSHGLLLSDHRYQGDLWVPSFAQLEGAAPVNLYASSRARLHLDGQNFYLGIGSHFSDPVLALERFSGYQVPVYMKFQSRMFALTRPDSKFPFYFQGKVEQRQIEVFRESRFAQTLPFNQSLQRLGNGSWQKLDLNISSPLTKHQIIQADFFADFQYRGVGIDKIHMISHDQDISAQDARANSKNSYSFLHTVSSGVHLKLPLDGTWRRESDSKSGLSLLDQKQAAQIIQHQMNWDLTFTLRPYAAKRGDYGKTSEYVQYQPATLQWAQVPGSRSLSYYPSDQSLYPSQLVTLKTSHEWTLFEQSWSLIPAQTSKTNTGAKATGEQKTEQQDLYDLAEQELMFSLDRPIQGLSEMLSVNDQWSINRYQLLDRKHLKPLKIGAQISFDYLKLKQRQEQEVANKALGTDLPLPEAWTPLNVTAKLAHSNWSLNVNGDYNLYKSLISAVNFHLMPPSFFMSQIGVQYNINQEQTRTARGDFAIMATRTRVITFSTGIIPHFSSAISYGIEKKDGQDASKMATVSSSYTSPTRCWGLRAAWTKAFTDETWDGQYYLGLVINFFNYPKTIGNMASRFNPKI